MRIVYRMFKFRHLSKTITTKKNPKDFVDQTLNLRTRRQVTRRLIDVQSILQLWTDISVDMTDS